MSLPLNGTNFGLRRVAAGPGAVICANPDDTSTGVQSEWQASALYECVGTSSVVPGSWYEGFAGVTSPIGAPSRKTVITGASVWPPTSTLMVTTPPSCCAVTVGGGLLM